MARLLLALTSCLFITACFVEDGEPIAVDEDTDDTPRAKGGSWAQETKFGGFRRFGDLGWSVALDGDTALIGERGQLVHTYVWSGTTWSSQGILRPSDGSFQDEYGTAVAVSGNIAVVGAFRDNAAGAEAGAAYVYFRTAAGWRPQGKLVGSDTAAGDEFGAAVDVDGDRVVIGAPRADAGAVDTGAVYVFRRSGATWTQERKLVPSDADINDQAGSAVAIDGGRVLIGAPASDSLRGAAYVFQRGPVLWKQQAKLLPTGIADGQFGNAVALHDNTAVIGAYQDDGPDHPLQGSAYVWTRAEFEWTVQAKLFAQDGEYSDGFGRSVAVDGDTVVVGASHDDAAIADGSGRDTGSAYVFTRGSAGWRRTAHLVPRGLDAYDFAGFSVAVSGDRVLMGAHGDDDYDASAGAAYLFSR
jgi:hypothetical protein